MNRFSQVVLIQNPVSGNGSEPARLAVRNEIAASGCLWRELVIEPNRSIASQTAELLRNGVDLVVVAGGDGTVSEVASTLVGKTVPLLIIPLGTFNNFARSLGIPADPIESCLLLHTGALHQVDVGIANGRHLFFEAAGVGIDAELFPLGEAVKQGRFAAIFRAVQLAFVYQQTTVDLKFDRALNRAYQRSFRGQSQVHHRRRRFRTNQRRVRLRSSFLAVGNCPYYGVNFMVCPDAKPDDGLLSVGVFRDFSKRELLLHFLSISRGRRQYHPKLEMFECGWLEVTAERKLPVHVDGRPIGTTPVRFGLRPNALTVVVPPSEERNFQRDGGESSRRRDLTSRLWFSA